MSSKSVTCICAILVIIVSAYAYPEAYLKARFKKIKLICEQAATIDEMLDACAENIIMPDYCIKCGPTYINLENLCTMFRSSIKNYFKEKPTRHAFRSCHNYRPKEIDHKKGIGNENLLNQIISRMNK